MNQPSSFGLAVERVPAKLVKKYGSFLHGNPYEERKICLSQELLDSDELKSVEIRNEPTIVFRAGGGEGRVCDPEDDSVLMDQTWLTAVEPAKLVKKYGSFLHGNPYEERKICLSQELHPKSFEQIVKSVEIRNEPTIVFRAGGGEGRVCGLQCSYLQRCPWSMRTLSSSGSHTLPSPPPARKTMV
jgi:hypothetical protein